MSKPNINIKDYFLTQELFQLIHDPNLDMYRTHPKPLNLEKYYESEHYISHNDDAKKFTAWLYYQVKKISLNYKLKLISQYSNDTNLLLDIGCGTGDFLNIAKNNNWKTSGVEPNSKAHEEAINKNLKISKHISDISVKQDVITLWHVLEHLPNLQQDIQSIKEILHANGTLIIAVPNFKSLDAKHYKHYWAAYDVPRHLWHFSQKSIKTLFNRNGFQLINTKPMLFDSFYVSLLSEKYKTGKQNYLRAFCIGLWSNITALFTKEYSSHIYILKKR